MLRRSFDLGSLADIDGAQFYANEHGHGLQSSELPDPGGARRIAKDRRSRQYSARSL